MRTTVQLIKAGCCVRYLVLGKTSKASGSAFHHSGILWFLSLPKKVRNWIKEEFNHFLLLRSLQRRLHFPVKQLFRKKSFHTNTWTCSDTQYPNNWLWKRLYLYSTLSIASEGQTLPSHGCQNLATQQVVPAPTDVSDTVIKRKWSNAL